MSFQDFFGGGKNRNNGNAQPLIGRVTNVIYGPFKSNGEVDSNYNDPVDIGSIKFVIFNSLQEGSLLGEGNPTAKPIWTGLRRLPLQNEYVLIFQGPSTDLNRTKGAIDYYYLPAFSLWGSPNHDAFPSLAEYAQYINIQQTYYDESLGGIPNDARDVNVEYPLGDNFFELANIKSLRPFVGDFLLEGRWGNSIRFGSSLLRNIKENNWSESNKEGDPIIIIRNGQDPADPTDNWFPTVEDINRDKSSIYLTAGQRIVIDDIQNSFSLKSFGISLKAQVTSAKTLTNVPNSNENLSPNLTDRLNDERGFPTTQPPEE